MEFRPHSSMPKLFKLQIFNSKKRPSVPVESLKNLFQLDFCSSIPNQKPSCKTFQSPENLNETSKPTNFKQKLIDVLSKKNETEYFSDSSPEKLFKKPKKTELFSPKNLLSSRLSPQNDYLLGTIRDISKSFRKRQNIENLKGINSKLESTQASSNVTTSKDLHAKRLNNLKQKDPKEEIYKFFAKENKKIRENKHDCDENIKKIMKSMQSLSRSENSLRGKNKNKKDLIKNEKKIVRSINKKEDKQIKNDQNFKNLKEIVEKCRNWLEYYKGKEQIYKKRIRILEEKVKELEKKK